MFTTWDEPLFFVFFFKFSFLTFHMYSCLYGNCDSDINYIFVYLKKKKENLHCFCKFGSTCYKVLTVLLFSQNKLFTLMKIIKLLSVPPPSLKAMKMLIFFSAHPVFVQLHDPTSNVIILNPCFKQIYLERNRSMCKATVWQWN